MKGKTLLEVFDHEESGTEALAEENPEAMLADGFEEAYIGICRRFGQEALAAYDYEKCIEILMKRDRMTREDAEEHFEYNVIGAWVGDGTPVYIKVQKKQERKKIRS